MIRHIVGWNLKIGFTEEEQKENAARIKAGLEAFKDLLPGVISIRVEIEPLNSSTRQIILISDFETEADLISYQIHPEHHKFSAFVGSVTTDRVCLDFLVEG